MDYFLEDFAPVNSAIDLQNDGSQDEDICLRNNASPAEVVHMIEQLACNFCDQLGTLSTVPDLVLKRERTLNCLCTSLCVDMLCLSRFFALCGIWLVESYALRSDTSQSCPFAWQLTASFVSCGCSSFKQVCLQHLQELQQAGKKTQLACGEPHFLNDRAPLQ